MNNKKLSLVMTLVLGVVFGACGGDDGIDPTMTKEEARAFRSADWGYDVCEQNGWYGDGECDPFCPLPDPGCEEPRNELGSWTTVLLADVESEHPYHNNTERTWTVHREGAAKIKLHIKWMEVERNYDSVSVYIDGQEHLDQVFDGVHNDVWTREFDSDTVYVTMRSDYIITLWGFEMDLVSYYKELDPCDGVVCDDPPNECYESIGTCSDGVCRYSYDDGASCDGGDACTVDDTCSGGECQLGSALDCDDDNVCTDDSCDPETGCVYSNNTAACDDENAHTNNDVCVDGSCIGGGGAVAPNPGVYGPTDDRWGVRLYEGSIAVNPYTGEIGFSWSEEKGSVNNSEIYFLILNRDGEPRIDPVRVTAAPGHSRTPRVLWNHDRYSLFWEDARHDPTPSECEPLYCRSEIYYTAFDIDGSLLVDEIRLTDKDDDILYLQGTVHPVDGDVMLTWVDERTGPREIFGALVSQDGDMRFEQQINETTPTHSEAYRPSALWNGEEWVIVYSDRRDGTDHVYVRTMNISGELGPEHRLFAGHSPHMVQRDVDKYTILADSNGPNWMFHFIDTPWSVSTTVPATNVGTWDGSLDMEWDGTSYYVTSSHRDGLVLVRFNNYGVEMEIIVICESSSYPYSNDVEMQRVGNTAVVEYHHHSNYRNFHKISVARISD